VKLQNNMYLKQPLSSGIVEEREAGSERGGEKRGGGTRSGKGKNRTGGRQRKI